MKSLSYESAVRNYYLDLGILSIVHPSKVSGSDAKFDRFNKYFARLYGIIVSVTGKLLPGVEIVRRKKQIDPLHGLKAGMQLPGVSPGPGAFQR
jgi:hypothetical protein